MKPCLALRHVTSRVLIIASISDDKKIPASLRHHTDTQPPCRMLTCRSHVSIYADVYVTES